MKRIAAALILIALAACAGLSESPSVSWGQQQAAYNKAAKTIAFYRTPCVDTQAYKNAGPDHPLCRVDDAAWSVVYPMMKEVDALLQEADTLIQSGQAPAAETYIKRVGLLMESVLVYQLQAQGGAL